MTRGANTTRPLPTRADGVAGTFHPWPDLLNVFRAPLTMDAPRTIAARIASSVVARVASNAWPVAAGKHTHHTHDNCTSVKPNDAFRANKSFCVYCTRHPLNRLTLRMPWAMTTFAFAVRNMSPNVSGVTVAAMRTTSSYDVGTATTGVAGFGLRTRGARDDDDDDLPFFIMYHPLNVR